MVSNLKFTFPGLTSIVQTLENFRDFEPELRAAAISLYASELAAQCGWLQEVAEIHCHRIAALLTNQEAV